MLRILRSRDYASRPWKNGGGTTRDIAVEPAAATLDDFHWRLSLAQVDRDGPFSRFDNVDRTLVLLEGALSLHERGATIDLVRNEPFVFPGERAIEATLPRGATTLDFNVMTRRDRTRHDVSRRRFDQQASLAATDASRIVLFALEGGLTIDGELLDVHDTAIITAHRAVVRVSAGSALALVVEIADVRPNVL